MLQGCAWRVCVSQWTDNLDPDHPSQAWLSRQPLSPAEIQWQLAGKRKRGDGKGQACFFPRQEAAAKTAFIVSASTHKWFPLHRVISAPFQAGWTFWRGLKGRHSSSSDKPFKGSLREEMFDLQDFRVARKGLFMSPSLLGDTKQGGH